MSTGNGSEPRPLAVAVTVVTLVGVALGIWAATQRLRSQRSPAAALDAGRPAALMPSPPRVREVVDGRIAEAVARLRDDRLAPAERIAGFEDALAEAERALDAGLAAHPLDAEAIARRATVRWERADPKDGPAADEALEGLRVASRLAPTVPGVQRHVGRLLLAMGHRDEGLAAYRRALELSDRLAPEVVPELRARLFPIDTVLDGLPTSAALLEAVEPWAAESGADGRLSEAAERHLRESGRDADPRTLRVLGNARLRLGEAAALATSLDAFPEPTDPEAAAERLRQRARAHVASGRTEAAVADARAAVERAPAAATYHEFLARTLLDAGRAEEAVEAARRALRRAAQDDDDAARARLYTLVGLAEEAAGEFDRAYDALERAVELAPDDPVARRNLDRLRAPGARSR